LPGLQKWDSYPYVIVCPDGIIGIINAKIQEVNHTQTNYSIAWIIGTKYTVIKQDRRQYYGKAIYGTCR